MIVEHRGERPTIEVFGVERPAPGVSKMPEVARRYGRALAKHLNDKIIEA